MVVAITLANETVSGGNTADTIYSSEFANLAAVESAVSSGFLTVNDPVAADGTALKARIIASSAIRQVVEVTALPTGP